MAAVVFLTFAFLISKAQSQIYGPGPCPGPWGLDGPGPYAAEIYGPCGPFGVDPYGTIPAVLPNIGPISQPLCPASVPFGQPILNNIAAPFIQNQIPQCSNLVNQPILNNPILPCPQPIFPNVPQVAPSLIPNTVTSCATAPAPVVTTTVVDNTLANSLANAIQLLIVSNLIENTLGSSSGCGNSLAQALGFLDSPCVNNFEVVSPDFYPNQVVTCQGPVDTYNPCINDISYYQEPSYQSPCLDVSPCSTGFGAFGFDNCGPNPLFGVEACSNPFGSQIVPFGCGEPALATIAPMAVEVPFPASIPAQLTCNFGYLPTNVPCVSVNVEPLPFDGCNFFGNLGNGFVY